MARKRKYTVLTLAKELDIPTADVKRAAGINVHLRNDRPLTSVQVRKVLELYPRETPKQILVSSLNGLNATEEAGPEESAKKKPQEDHSLTKERAFKWLASTLSGLDPKKEYDIRCAAYQLGLNYTGYLGGVAKTIRQKLYDFEKGQKTGLDPSNLPELPVIKPEAGSNFGDIQGMVDKAVEVKFGSTIEELKKASQVLYAMVEKNSHNVKQAHAWVMGVEAVQDQLKTDVRIAQENINRTDEVSQYLLEAIMEVSRILYELMREVDATFSLDNPPLEKELFRMKGEILAVLSGLSELLGKGPKSVEPLVTDWFAYQWKHMTEPMEVPEWLQKHEEEPSEEEIEEGKPLVVEDTQQVGSGHEPTLLQRLERESQVEEKEAAPEMEDTQPVKIEAPIEEGDEEVGGKTYFKPNELAVFHTTTGVKLVVILYTLLNGIKAQHFGTGTQIEAPEDNFEKLNTFNEAMYEWTNGITLGFEVQAPRKLNEYSIGKVVEWNDENKKFSVLFGDGLIVNDIPRRYIRPWAFDETSTRKKGRDSLSPRSTEVVEEKGLRRRIETILDWLKEEV